MSGIYIVISGDTVLALVQIGIWSEIYLKLGMLRVVLEIECEEKMKSISLFRSPLRW
jgi:hypothetical protein